MLSCGRRFAEPRPVCPEAELVVVRGLQKSGTTWLEYLVEALIREHCQETGECETWGQPNDIGLDRGSTGTHPQPSSLSVVLFTRCECVSAGRA
jgi:hypothetical protein